MNIDVKQLVNTVF